MNSQPSMQPLHPIESTILEHHVAIESWFRAQWQKTPAPITTSVDLRQAGFKMVPVDTNLFPAGYNNLNPKDLPLCVLAVQSTLANLGLKGADMVIVPENHTRNEYYMKSLLVLRDIFVKSGLNVRLGSMDETLLEPRYLDADDGEQVSIEPLKKQDMRLYLDDFEPSFLLLNNDLSSGVPDLLENLQQRIEPLVALGWNQRLKSTHFGFYREVCLEFSASLGIDPWLIEPMFVAHEAIDFMSQLGVERLAEDADVMLQKIRDKYQEYGIQEQPFVVVKSDNGTYGMSVMMVHSGQELLQLNRKQRTKMAANKGRQKVERVIIQEGVHTIETTVDGSVAEPVVYLIGSYVVGGFYRVHQERGKADNLNAPGMHFEPLPFSSACNVPCLNKKNAVLANRFYVYGVLARLAALAAAREMHALESV